MQLVFLCTFEELHLPARGPMDLILFMPPLNNVLGKVPLFLLFLDGNATPTIPHHLRHLKASAFQHGAADAAKLTAGRESTLTR